MHGNQLGLSAVWGSFLHAVGGGCRPIEFSLGNAYLLLLTTSLALGWCVNHYNCYIRFSLVHQILSLLVVTVSRGVDFWNVFITDNLRQCHVCWDMWVALVCESIRSCLMWVVWSDTVGSGVYSCMLRVELLHANDGKYMERAPAVGAHLQPAGLHGPTQSLVCFYCENCPFLQPQHSQKDKIQSRYSPPPPCYNVP